MQVLVAVALTLGSCTMALAQTRFTFDQDPVGKPPSGFDFAVTANAAPGAWVVVEDDTPARPHVLAQSSGAGRGSRFPMAIVQSVTAADVDVSVKIKPVRGSEDQAGGLVWRYQDANNYYVVRANALEGNVVLYKVQNGRRVDLPLKGEGRTYGKKAAVPSGQWSTLRAVTSGTHIEVYWNEAKLFEAEDSTFTRAGKVGLWTKADSVTYFDDLAVLAK
jgi:hypothetical protein